MSSLDGCYLKLLRAREHFDLLQAEIERSRESILSAVLTEVTFDLERGECSLHVVKAPRVPPRFSVILGDVVHNLRSALDYLAHQVTALHPDGPYDKSLFPIVDKPADLDKGRNKKTLAHFTAEQRTVVEWHQPYNSPARNYGTGPLPDRMARFNSNIVLRDLRDLSNSEKRCSLVEGFVLPDAQGMLIVPVRHVENLQPSFYGTFALEEGTELARFDVEVTGVNPHVRVDLDFTPQISLLGGTSVEVLDLAATKVLTIVREFEPFF